MASNPRIEDLRKRIEKDPASRLFAQLAEELRKDGELEDAIRVARAGLANHPNYPSARMTLGRALLDTGDWAAARTEFELVLKGAADNILASRYLGECLENLGERDAAIARYKATLALAPGEKHVVARLQELEGKAGPAAGKPAAATPAPTLRPTAGLRPATPVPPMLVPAAPALAAPVAPAAPLPPIPLSAVEGEMELETSRPAFGPGASPPPATEPVARIPLVEAPEEFELERPYESPTTGIGTGMPAVAPPPPVTAAAPPAAPAPVPPPPPPAVEEEFELEAPHEAPSTGWAASIRPLPPLEEEPRAAPAIFQAAVPPPAAPARVPSPPAPAAAAPAAAGSALISPTLGELYFNQGFTDKAIEVYRELSAREPANERLSARLRELEKLHGALAGGGAAAAAVPAAPGKASAETPVARAAASEAFAGDALPGSGADRAPAERREAIERTIARLEGLLSAIRKG